MMSAGSQLCVSCPLALNVSCGSRCIATIAAWTLSSTCFSGHFLHQSAARSQKSSAKLDDLGKMNQNLHKVSSSKRFTTLFFPSKYSQIQQTKAYYQKDLDRDIQQCLAVFAVLPDTSADMADISNNLSALIGHLRFFWEWLQDRNRPLWKTFFDLRNEFLHCLIVANISNLVPCFHYLTNHTWEDYLSWGSLKTLVAEAGEASHARDNRRRWGTCRGRTSGRDTFNTWAIMLRNFYAAKELERTGVRDRFVRSKSESLFHLTLSICRMPEELREDVAGYMEQGCMNPVAL